VLVGVAGFEPAPPSSRTRCATRPRIHGFFPHLGCSVAMPGAASRLTFETPLTGPVEATSRRAILTVSAGLLGGGSMLLRRAPPPQGGADAAAVCISNPLGRGVGATSAARNRSKPFIENRTKSSVGRRESGALAWDA
jgi:hypothetical protein